MNFKQLKYFYEIANEKQITRAAKKLHISQPPLSQSLQALEATLGCALFERNGHTMELTEAGEVLYEKTKKLLDEIDDTMREVKETGQGVRGSITIGCNRSCFAHIPQAVRQFQQHFPHVQIQLIEGDSYQLTNQLLRREIELAIIRLPADLEKFHYFRLPDEKYVAMVSKQYLSEKNKTTITIKELSELPLFLLHRIKGTGQFEIFMNMFQKNDLTPHIIGESPNVDMIIGLIKEGLGATILPESICHQEHSSNIHVLEIEEVELISKSAVLTLKERYLSKKTKRFIQLLQKNRHHIYK